MADECFYTVFETVAGFAAIGWNGTGVCSFRLPAGSAREAERALLRRLPDAGAAPPPLPVRAVIDGAVRYFAGGRVDFGDVPVDLGVQQPFFERVYTAVRRLGWGETATYGAIAKLLDAGPEFARDVGQAMAANPVPLIIPCHRVTAANGRIGGFSAPGGSHSKAQMLAIEGVEVRDGVVTRDVPQLGLGF
ncbi:methylated-DNA-[protein]-cysteine S-methyltransferase [Sphingomonas kyeonggiensis]|uniref:Methylated-DNA-[protein]-cysteine S-methyltransferase n=1 Tax=Sphingomonas kyeonggiensis TaxID=1268553 RepID=A0A7W7JYG7_9SPHN|nr:methylated-DNA--[protein]-cysteine S-methyltransferase [Sphingomonas kyeonggiensis]MBB4837686.1 methylated-DNA-[protein]-cysteine S-methyltransferase [Sphingomonas kyeonggiensis]